MLRRTKRSRDTAAQQDLGHVHDPREALEAHLRSFFGGHSIERRTWGAGPIAERIPEFHVFEIAPGPRFRGWTYVTAGCWASTADHGHGLEFVLSSNAQDVANVEALFMLAYYNAGPESQRMDWGHTVPVGEPWRGGRLDHFLIATPYAYGPDFEMCRWATGHARLLALMPISRSERDFKVEHGVEALEQLLEDAAVDFADPLRASVV